MASQSLEGELHQVVFLCTKRTNLRQEKAQEHMIKALSRLQDNKYRLDVCLSKGFVCMKQNRVESPILFNFGYCTLSGPSEDRHL